MQLYKLFLFNTVYFYFNYFCQKLLFRMIQRMQSIFLLFSGISLLVIIYLFPILKDTNNNLFYFISKDFYFINILLLFSVFLSFFSIFKFKQMSFQRLLASISSLLITISLILIVFVYKQDRDIGLGLWLLSIPFLSLKLAVFFIKRDEKLIRSSDRIR